MATSSASTLSAGDLLLTRMIHQFWRKLDSPPSPPFTFDEVRTWPPDSLARVQELGLLEEIEPATEVYLSECVEPDWHTPVWVTRPSGQVQGICGCGIEGCSGLHYVEPERMRQWAPRFASAAKAVAGAVEAPHCEELVPERVAFLGSLQRDGVYRELFLARGLWWDDAAVIMGQAERFRRSTAPALLALSRLPDPELWRPCSPALLSVKELVKVQQERCL